MLMQATTVSKVTVRHRESLHADSDVGGTPEVSQMNPSSPSTYLCPFHLGRIRKDDLSSVGYASLSAHLQDVVCAVSSTRGICLSIRRSTAGGTFGQINPLVLDALLAKPSGPILLVCMQSRELRLEEIRS